jgi:hypothetical protein
MNEHATWMFIAGCGRFLQMKIIGTPADQSPSLAELEALVTLNVD